MRAATLEEDYPNSNMMVQEQLEDGSWSEPRTFRKGDVQPMIFSEGDGPPFYSPSLDPNNYVNMPKGIRQVLWERGLLKPDMTLDVSRLSQPNVCSAAANRDSGTQMRPAPSEFNPGEPKYKPYGKIKDDIELGVWSLPSAEEGRSKCDLNLKPGVSKVTLEKIKERLLMSHTKGIEAVPSTRTHSRSSEIDEEALINQWHLDDDDPDMADEVSIEETGEPEAESGQVSNLILETCVVL
ncbi:hypothetical protein EMCRGX_G033588 [Ephydatia muelleri]